MDAASNIDDGTFFDEPNDPNPPLSSVPAPDRACPAPSTVSSSGGSTTPASSERGRPALPSSSRPIHRHDPLHFFDATAAISAGESAEGHRLLASSPGTPVMSHATPTKRHVTLQLPTTKALREKYETFLLRHTSVIQFVESAIRLSTYLIPNSSQLSSECAFAFLNILSTYHTNLLTTRTAHGRDSAFNQWTLKCYRKSPRFRRLGYCLAAIQYTQTLMEMLVRTKLGAKAQWRLIIGLEAIKSAVRILLVREGGNRMLLASQVPDRGVAKSKDKEEQRPTPCERHLLRRTGKVYEGLGWVDHDGGVVDYLWKRMQGKRLVELAPAALWGEYIYCVRPLIYVLLLQLRGRRSWSPWFVSLALDCLARKLSLEQDALTQLEATELKRRMFQLLYYIARPPVYDTKISPKVDRLVAGIRKRSPAIADLISSSREWWEQYYFCTSAS